MGIRKLLGREGALAGARRELLEGLPPGTTGVEVGVWKGDFSAQILKIAKPAVLHLVDPWQFQPEFSKSWFGGGEARSQADMDAIHQSVADRFAAQIAEGRVVLHRAPSAAAAADFAPASLDWVYIDGNHEYEYVRDDLAAYLPLVRPGGLVMGDDYTEGGWFKGGVKRAVDEWAADRDLRITDRQFVVKV